MPLFEPVFAALEQVEARYVVVGGVAVVLHGSVRFTMDLDLVLDPDPDSAGRAMAALTSAGLRPVVPVDPMLFCDPATRRVWAEQRNMVVFSLRDPDHPLRMVDVLLESPIEFEQLWSRALVIQLPECRVRVASIPDLIDMKRRAGRPKDLEDVRDLCEIDRLRSAEEPR